MAMALLAHAYPSVVELDLVFPRNETYLPVYPFPMVFALRNPSAIWPFDFSFTSELGWYNERLGREIWTDGGFQNLGHFPNNQFHEDHDSTEYPVAQLGEPLPNCTKNASRAETVGFSRLYAGNVELSFVPDGILPDFNNYEGCPIPAATIGIQDLMVPQGFQWEVGNCPVLQDNQPSPNPCGLNVTEQNLGPRVAKAMMESIHCEGGAEAWPNSTADSCKELTSSATSSYRSIDCIVAIMGLWLVYLHLELFSFV
ncbi:hypothetical protein PHISP_01265 [Aspergillus sp. HF37]|nr:hypothetical protein PHISP_01265 [Aspergillus sp. HF37]